MPETGTARRSHPSVAHARWMRQLTRLPGVRYPSVLIQLREIDVSKLADELDQVRGYGFEATLAALRGRTLELAGAAGITRLPRAHPRMQYDPLELQAI